MNPSDEGDRQENLLQIGSYTQDPLEELLDLVDSNDQVIGRKSRAEIYAEKLSCYRAINGFVVNQRGQLWIPRRAPHAIIFPLCLDMSVGGHVRSGETYEEAFRRELKEELDFDLSQFVYQELGYLRSHQDNVSSFMKVYEIQADEVSHYNRNDFIEFYWLTPGELMERIKNGDQAKSDLPRLLNIFYSDRLD